MKLNRTGSNWTELERNKINENWGIIEGKIVKVEDGVANIIGEISDEAFNKIVDSAKLNWKEPVDTVEDLPSGASVGDTRMVRSGDKAGKVYRYDGSIWVEIQEIDATAINEVDSRINSRLDNIETLSESIKNVASANAIQPLDIPTYVAWDNHAVHPSVIWDSSRKYGYEWIMAFTPYSRSDDRYENPSIVVSNNGFDWFVPEGLTNPLVTTPNPGITHYSDTEIIDNGTELEMWYRYSDKSEDVRQSSLYRMKSTDCVNWSEPELMFPFGTSGYGLGAPSIIYRNGEYNLYYRDNMNIITGKYVLRKSTNGYNWSDPIEINHEYPSMWDGYNGWHNEYRYIDGKYIAIVQAIKPPNDDRNYKLFAFESDDGINFNNCRLIMAPSSKGWDSDRVYKSSVVKWGNLYYLYYSAFAKDNSNYIGLSIGNSLTNLVGYDKFIDGKIKLDEINSLKEIIPVRKSLNILNRIHISKPGEAIAYLGVDQNHFIKSYRYSSGSQNGGFEGVGFLFNEQVGSGFPWPNGNFLTHDSETERLQLRNQNMLMDIPKMIHFRYSPASKNFYYYAGENNIASIESTSYGFDINLKGIPADIKASLQVSYADETLPKSANDNYAEHFYIRTRTNTKIGVGINSSRTNASAAKLPLESLVFGIFEVTILF